MLWDLADDSGSPLSNITPLDACELVSKAIASYGVATQTPPELYPLGLSIVDRNLGGVSPRLFVTIAAGTGIGKSSVMLSCAYRSAKQGCPVGIVSLEDPAEMIGARLVAKLTGINDLDIRRNILSDRDRSRILDVTVELAGLPLYTVEVLGAGLDETAAAVESLAIKGCKVIFVDYLQLVWAEGYSDARAAMKRTLGTLQGLAKKYAFALVGVSQVRRPSEGKEAAAPTRFMLKESGDLENSSKLLLVIWRDAQDITHVKIEKSNCGGEGLKQMFKRGPDGQLHDVIADSRR